MEKIALLEINRPLGMSYAVPKNSSQVLCSKGDNDLSSSMRAAFRPGALGCAVACAYSIALSGTPRVATVWTLLARRWAAETGLVQNVVGIFQNLMTGFVFVIGEMCCSQPADMCADHRTDNNK